MPANGRTDGTGLSGGVKREFNGFEPQPAIDADAAARRCRSAFSWPAEPFPCIRLGRARLTARAAQVREVD